MTLLPPIPGWDGFHPLVVDFTIALLVLAPLFVLVSFFARHQGRPWENAALLTLALGVFAAWLAVGSGHAGATLVERARGLGGPLLRHEQLGILTRNLFTVLAVAFLILVTWPSMIRRPMPRAAAVTLKAVFLVLYVGAGVVLGNAAWRGAQLVHDHGVHAVVPGDTAEEPPAIARR